MSTQEKLIELLANEQILLFENNFLMSTMVDGERVIVCSKQNGDPRVIGYNDLTNICSDEVIASQINVMHDNLVLTNGYQSDNELKQNLEENYSAGMRRCA